jgi:endonuclease III
MPRSRTSSGTTAAPVPDVLRVLRADYGDAGCSLAHTDPFELLVATILSAQCTDARVNQVTPALFREFPDAGSMAAASQNRIEELIRSTGFFRSKAKSILGAARAIVRSNGGAVPRTIDALVALPGVGRKTANVVLGNVFGQPAGVVVDTHVGRLARRLGWSRHTDPEKVEADLNRLVPRSRWVWVSHALILHGRAVCNSRKPRCESCRLAGICPKVGTAAPDQGAARRRR